MNVGSHFIRIGLRHVHYRRAGSGPAVLLLHQSPQSSTAMLPWFAVLAGRFTVIAPDTPGFGHSDPLPRQQPGIADLAEALEEFCAALGLERVAVLGVHTGAVIGLSFALEHPERVALLICDGYARFDPDEKQALLARYLPPFEPAWDGSHLLWLWARLREQHLYFPWHDDRAECRLSYPLPAPAQLQRDTMDLLAAGDGYRLGYRAPFLHDDPDAPRRLAVPAVLLYRDGDVLAPHRARLPPLPACATSETVAGGQSRLEGRVAELLDARHAAAPPAPPPARDADATPWSRRIVATRLGPLALRASRPGSLGTVVLSAPCRAPHGVVPGFVADRTRGTACIELPGHGASTPWHADALAPDAIADAIAEALAVLGAPPVRVISEGASAALALALAERHPGRVESLCLREPWLLEDAERETLIARLPSTTPDASGSHLLAAWNWVRLGALFRPWAAPSGDHARRVAAPPPYLVHAHALEVLRLGERLAPLWRGLLASGLDGRIAACAHPITLEAGADEQLAARIAAIAAGNGFAPEPVHPARYQRPRGTGVPAAATPESLP